MATMKVFTRVSRKLLDLYNETMEAHGEEPYMIEVGNVHDCATDVLRDTAWNEANPDGGNGAYPAEFLLEAAFLTEEVRWNLLEKQEAMIRDAVDFGEISHQRGTAMRKANALAHEKFAEAAAKQDTPEAEPWLVAEIELDYDLDA